MHRSVAKCVEEAYRVKMSVQKLCWPASTWRDTGYTNLGNAGKARADSLIVLTADLRSTTGRIMRPWLA